MFHSFWRFSGSKLKEAGDQQQFNRNVEDVELWLAEIEGSLMSEDYGKVLLKLNPAMPSIALATHEVRVKNKCFHINGQWPKLEEVGRE